MGDYTKSQPLYQKIIEIRRRTLGEDHPDYAVSLNSLAIMYYEMEATLKLKPLYQKIIEIRRRTLGEDHPDHQSV